MYHESKVKIIPASKNFMTNPKNAVQEKILRVAAYCRVSTGDEEQLTSYTKQKDYYTNLIKNNSQWEFAGIYADEGISGTSTKKRTEFNRMINDARNGKFDLILTKSISRFSRNTEDTLKYIKELRLLPNPVNIHFEKENLDSFDQSSEFIITLLSAQAQSESRSISSNVRWSLQKNFQNGKPTINLNRMLGYDMGENGEWVINEEQAEIVREIYNMYLCGISASRIANLLNDKNMLTVNGKKWSSQTVLKILRNEKFAGDLEMQKNITVDMLSHISKRNDGEAQKYYIQNHHIPIISKEVWNKVQLMLNKNRYEKIMIKKRDKFAVFSNLVCGVCGKPFKRIRYSLKIYNLSNSTTECFFSYPILKCEQNCKTKENTKKLKKREKRCYSEYLHECAIHQSFMEKLYDIRQDLLQNGSNAKIVQEYYTSCLERSLYYEDYQRVVRNIAEANEVLEETTQSQKELSVVLGKDNIFDNLIEEYQNQCADLENQKNQIFKQIIYNDENKPIFDYFVECILKLPDINFANQSPCLISFEKGIYLSFVKYGMVYGDVIEYQTKFGVSFQTHGNSLKIEDFIDYKKITDSGKSMIISEPYEVINTQLQYRKKK